MNDIRKVITHSKVAAIINAIHFARKVPLRNKYLDSFCALLALRITIDSPDELVIALDRDLFVAIYQLKSYVTNDDFNNMLTILMECTTHYFSQKQLLND